MRLGSRVKWSNPGNGVEPSQHLGIVALEKGAFESPSTTGANFTISVKNQQNIMSNKLVYLFSTNRNWYNYIYNILY